MKFNKSGIFIKIFLGLWVSLFLFSTLSVCLYILSDNDILRLIAIKAHKSQERRYNLTAIKYFKEYPSDVFLKKLEDLNKKENKQSFVFDSYFHEMSNKRFSTEVYDAVNTVARNRIRLVRQISDDKTVTAIILPADKNVEEYTPLYLVAIHDRLPNISVFTYTFIEYFKELLMHLIVISVTSFFLARHFTKPMKMLNDASERIADGVFDIQLDEVAERKDEFGELARKFMEMVERLEENMQQQRRMFRDISHELRSPLTRMRLALEIASSKTDGEAAELMKRVETEWERMSFMINDLKKIASCSDASIPMEQIDICELLDSLMPDFLFESRALGLNVTLECSNCCKINGNRRLLASAFENIVRNALRYAKKDIKINVIMGNRNVVVSVLDDGNGVEPDNLEKIFLPFFKEDQNRDRASGGTGLGLAIAKKIVSSHSGEIHAKKPAEGGLKIIMSFPV